MRRAALTMATVAGIAASLVGWTVVAASEWNQWTNLSMAQCVAVSGDSVWLGTAGGLVEWNAADGSFVRHLAPEGFPDNSVTAAAVDAVGRVWIGMGTWNGGLAVLDQGAWTTWDWRNGLASDWVNALALDASGRIRIGTLRGLSVLDTGVAIADTSDDTAQTFIVEDGLGNLGVNGLCIDKTGRIWCATSGGVSVLDPHGTPFDKSDDVWVSFQSSGGLLSDTTYGIAEDEVGRIWIAGKNGVSVLAPGELSDPADDAWQTFGTEQGLPSNTVCFAVALRAGTAWIAHQKGLIALEGAATPFDPSDDRVTPFAAADGLVKSYVRAIAFDNRGIAWCAVPGGGLDRLDANNTPSDKADDTWTAYTIRDELPSADVRAILVQQGAVWIGTSSGLVAISDTGLASYSVGVPLGICSASGVLWIGTTGGLVALEGGASPFDTADDVVTQFSSGDGLTSNYVENLSLDAAGRVWCVAGKGISVLDPAGTPHDKKDDRWASFTTADGLSGENPNAIVAEGDRRVWVVHESDSLSALDYGGTPFDKTDDVWVRFGQGSPIGVGSGYSAVVDAAGVKWFGVCNGLFALDDGGTLVDTSDDRWQRFDIGDCNPGLAIDDAGRIWVASGWSGVTMLDDGGTPFDPADDATVTYTIANGLIDDRAQAIAVDGEGVWIGTDGGLSLLQP